MKAFDTESLGIFNSGIFRPNIRISEIRRTTMFEFELPIEPGGISYIDDKSAKIVPNSVICAKPGQNRHTKFPHKCYYIHVNIYDSEAATAAMRLPEFVYINDKEKYLRIFKSIIEYGNSDCEYDRCMLYSQLLRLIHLLSLEVAHGQNESSGRFSSSYVNTAAKFIDEHLSEELTLERVSEQVSLSPIYFHNCFKAATGRTLHSYIEDKRIEKSIYLMLTTDMALTDIAYSCGFSSQSYYSYVFKRKKGTTPRKYIRRLNENYTV